MWRESGQIRDLKAARAARKLVGQEVFDSNKKTEQGQSVLDSLVLAIMRHFSGKGNKHDIGCYAERAIYRMEATGRSEGGAGKAGRRSSGPKTPNSM